MTFEEAKKIFLNRGFIDVVDGVNIFDGDKWRQACVVISDFIEDLSDWIPVTKREPKKSDIYLCTFGGSNLIGKDYYITESDAKEMFSEPEKYTGWHSHNVIAWMPLPKSYQAESEGEK